MPASGVLIAGNILRDAFRFYNFAYPEANIVVIYSCGIASEEDVFASLNAGESKGHVGP